ncbi:Hsp33 family molecular chaperone HslO [Oribacterium sp. HCP28S3_H8]|jgi:molecular chaperone Hsp33|uniref:Hsp33 family molecular chaperone HslO n=1 Tax=Oribacterium sp. HCP28S3_H8 TaxID=3438945 RepID=UPI0030488A8F|nr:Hsp33 family molecular chaperone HslO [Oribacterium sp.]
MSEIRYAGTSQSGDYVIRATAAEGQVRAFACSTRHVAEEARRIHNTAPICTAALGRLMSAALMMAVDMKGDKDLLTLTIKGDGPMKGLTVTADSHGHVKGFCANSNVLLPANASGHLNVGGAIGKGMLSVIKDIGLKEPYVGQTQLISGEIAEDLTYYFAVSEQVPSSVGLGVLMEKNNTVKQAGGFIIQLMPGCSDEVITQLENKLKTIKSVTAMLDEGMSPEEMLQFILGDMKLEINDRKWVSFYCNCSREVVSRALISLGRKELTKLADEHQSQEVKCDFCGKAYQFSPEELKQLLRDAK